jgi:aldehyde dehydrogenase (NAD+)
MEDEVFGPILPILTYQDSGRGPRQDRRNPASTDRLHLQPRAEDDRPLHWRAVFWRRRGQVNIHLFVETMPSGGVGPAGMGHYYGKYGFDMLTHAKSMLISPPDVAIDHLFPPYTPEKNAALKQWLEC